jgi:AcrR family transcriptional regulator
VPDVTQTDAGTDRFPAVRGWSFRRDPVATRDDIMQVAAAEFSQYGLAGARIDRIAAQTHTSKRMIYYYFDSKENLYSQVLLDAFRRIRETETDLGLDNYEPVAGLQTLIRSTIQHYEATNDFIRLVIFENSYEVGAVHLRSDQVRAMNRSALEVIDDLLVRGCASGVFREGLNPLDIHQLITAQVVFRVSQRHSWAKLYGRDMLSEVESPHTRTLIEDTVLRFVLKDPEHTVWPLGRPRDTQVRRD